MRLEFLNPSTVAAPAGSYTHAVLVPPGARTLHISGQVGVRADGTLADGIEAQSEAAWSNVVALLQAAGMDVHDLVSITSLVTRAEHFAAYAKVRARFLGDARPASTAWVVPALVRPDWLVEVAAVAARA
jgi:enamine deaminase RidA (YjgF/YER057c/UK114 family)